nr:hypothetical protein [uncultured Campylobacter sp.]
MFRLRCKGARELIVKGRRRSVDFERGETLFGDDAPRAIWYISSEASSSRTWLWGGMRTYT